MSSSEDDAGLLGLAPNVVPQVLQVLTQLWSLCYSRGRSSCTAPVSERVLHQNPTTTTPPLVLYSSGAGSVARLDQRGNWRRLDPSTQITQGVVDALHT